MQINNNTQSFFFNVIPYGIENHPDNTKLWLKFSVKFNVDLNNAFKENDNTTNIEFIESFIEVSEFLKTNPGSSFKLTYPGYEKQLDGEYIPPVHDNIDNEALCKELWSIFFSKEKTYLEKVKKAEKGIQFYQRNFIKDQITNPEYFQDPDKLTSKAFIKEFIDCFEKIKAEEIGEFSLESIYKKDEFKNIAKDNYDKIVLKSKNVSNFSNSLIELNNKEVLAFSKQFIDTKEANDSITFIKRFYHLASEIVNHDKISGLDINEVLYRFNAIEQNKHLARLFGLIKDYKISIDKSELDSITEQKVILIRSSFSIENGLTEHLPSKIKFIKSNQKYACLLTSETSNPEGSYSENFSNSVLKSTDSIIQSYNELAFENAFNNGDAITNQATRGIIYRNAKLKNLIKPIENTPDVFDEESLTSGYRVALHDKKGLKSLTVRSTKLDIKGYNFDLFDEEAGIKIDAAMQYLDNGDLKTTISDQLFNYEGELFNLNSPFGRNENITENEPQTERDLSLELAKFKLDKLVSYSVFPSNNYEDNDSFIKYRYSIPKLYLNTPKFSPKLRFFKSYRFVVYQEYDNGWGLPLKIEDENNIQLTIQDLIGKEKELFLTKDFEFIPLEDKRQVQLFNRFEQDYTKKEVKEALIVKSDHYEDHKQFTTQKHCLGPRIEFETAWLFGEFDRIKKKTFNIKKRANCEFENEDDYNQSGSNCCEGCTQYCGGTQMSKFYNKKHIKANYLTDPTVEGIKARLLLADGLQEIDQLPNPINFKLNKNSNVIDQESILIKASGGNRKSFLSVNGNKDILDINIKKGAELYLYLTNSLSNNGIKQLEKGWWDNGLKYVNNGESLRVNKSYKKLLKKIVEEQNKPKKIKLIHAVKKPLITPQILSLNSFADKTKQTSHIIPLLKDEYKTYGLEKNIIAKRVAESKDGFIGSTKVKVTLKALFERLDCFKTKENQINFIKEVLPTGSLELWMRKEKYIDDSDEYIFPQSEFNKRISPNIPLVDFEDEKNIFSLEHKIEFSDEVLEQLRDYWEINGKDSKDVIDEFVEIISKINLEIDIKSDCFEEREYYLRNTSKFIGYFDSNNKYQSKLNSRGEIDLVNDTEEFSLPTADQVMKDLDENSLFRFKALALNNQKPAKPVVKYSITTIQEKRELLSRKNIVSIQKGNIVTIYFERGRLTSGKNERIGLIINSDGIYHQAFKQRDLISKTGRDIVSDKYYPSNHDGYLGFNDIIIPKDNVYQAEFNDELGIFHYLPLFDIERQLWKIEVEFNIKTKNNKDLHNPFIQLAFINYQPFSINYAEGNDFEKDCRISDIETSTWCYLLPERQLSVSFDFPGFLDKTGYIDLTLAFDHESLHHDLHNGKIRSNFILSIEGSNDSLIWYPVHSKNKTTNHIACHHALIDESLYHSEIDFVKKSFAFDVHSTVSPFDPEKWIKYKEYRVRLVEVEWFTSNSPIDFDNIIEDILNDRRFKIRYVELIN